MFRLSQYISRKETASSVANRFGIDNNSVMLFLDFYYPRLFFPLISSEEYLEFSREVVRSLNKI